jgi:hypothetical protein
MYVKFIKSKWHLSFKEDWDWAPVNHEIKERPGRQKGDSQGSTFGFHKS